MLIYCFFEFIYFHLLLVLQETPCIILVVFILIGSLFIIALPYEFLRVLRDPMIVLPIAGVLGVVALLTTLAYVYYPKRLTDHNQDEGIRYALIKHAENQLEEALKRDKGMGCEIPKLDPFSKEITQFDKKSEKIKCYGQDWVKCYHSKCRVLDAIRGAVKDISCTFKDIIHQSDQNYTIGPRTLVEGDGVYELKKSDHVKVACVGKRKDNDTSVSWSGNTLGFRAVPPPPAPPGREDSLNVVIFCFDSTARNGFIRRMPKSWNMLKEIGATVMEGYNIVGDGTPAALFPILTGKTELESPDVRKGKHNNRSMDSFPFIFYKLKQDGYRTAFFEDEPRIGTFQYRLNGFRHQPTDHYLRSFYIEDLLTRPKNSSYCLGDTPQFKVMINITEQFLELGGKRFIFTFISDIAHDDFNLIENADDDTAAFMRRLLSRAEDTLIVVMGDHGPRVRSTNAQLRLLVDYMSTNHMFAVGEFSGPLGAQQMEAEWAKVQALLTEAGPAKSIQQWKHTWRDLKKKAREEAGRARVARGLTGNAAVVPEPSALSIKILEIIGKECAVGLSVEAETGVGELDLEDFFVVAELPNAEPTPGPSSSGTPAAAPTPPREAAALAPRSARRATTPRPRPRRQLARALGSAARPSLEYLAGQKQQIEQLKELVAEQKMKNLILKRQSKRGRPTPCEILRF